MITVCGKSINPLLLLGSKFTGPLLINRKYSQKSTQLTPLWITFIHRLLISFFDFCTSCGKVSFSVLNYFCSYFFERRSSLCRISMHCGNLSVIISMRPCHLFPMTLGLKRLNRCNLLTTPLSSKFLPISIVITGNNA